MVSVHVNYVFMELEFLPTNITSGGVYDDPSAGKVFLCSAPTPPPASSKKTATGCCEVHRIERPPWHRAASELEHACETTQIATVTSQRSGYIRTCHTQWLREHGESVVTRTEPIIQLTPSPASSEKAATGSCEVHRIERPPWHRAASGLEHARGTTPIATVTSQRSGYKRTVDTQWLRGHGESVVTRTEPIIQLLKVLLCSAPTPSPASSKKMVTGSCEVHRTERPPWHRAASGLEHARGTTPVASVKCQRIDYIKTINTQWLRRHGESVVMRTGPIILLLQVIRFAKSFRSDNRFIIVLPCHKVCASCALEYVYMLLKLSGDIELNPGRNPVEKMVRKF
ncbi:hypothetical protein MRX96_057072 [Rhipicephalus microplus]